MLRFAKLTSGTKSYELLHYTSWNSLVHTLNLYKIGRSYAHMQLHACMYMHHIYTYMNSGARFLT